MLNLGGVRICHCEVKPKQSKGEWKADCPLFPQISKSKTWPSRRIKNRSSKRK